MSYADHHAAHLRLAILRLLAEATGYRLNSSVLADSCVSLGFETSRDRLKTELAWLAEQALVTTSEPTPGLVVAVLTERGADVAAGRATVPGVQRPAPKG